MLNLLNLAQNSTKVAINLRFLICLISALQRCVMTIKKAYSCMVGFFLNHFVLLDQLYQL